MRRIETEDLRELCDWAQPEDRGGFAQALADTLGEYRLLGSTREWRQARDRLEAYIDALECAAQRLDELEAASPPLVSVDRHRSYHARTNDSLQRDRGSEAEELAVTDDVAREHATLRRMIEANREALDRLEVRKGSHAERRDDWLVPAILNALLYHSQLARSWNIEQRAEFVRETLLRAGVQFPAVHSSGGDRADGYKIVARALKSVSLARPAPRVRVGG